MATITILQGDNIKLLKRYPDNYFDSVVTDCPYGLGKEPNALKLLQDWIDHGYHEIKGKGFMGKSWDAFVPQPLFWKEVFRVLKPGGYVLAFFGTRTYDWGTMAIRLAGFEIRDMITWHYGSGFPKSLDVSKAIDNHKGEKRVKKLIPTKNGNRKLDQGEKSNTFSTATHAGYTDISEPVSHDANKYSGYGTALKPATEPICVARKPLDGTVAENILKYGTGGINLDGCRIDFQSNETDSRIGTDKSSGNIVENKFFAMKNSEPAAMYKEGRFPANVIFDPYMANELDMQTGVLTSGKPVGTRKAQNNIYGVYAAGQEITGFGDSGGASRFFYCAKASQEERHLGCENFQSIKVGDGRNIVNDTAFQRGDTERKNHHPTVKPIALIRYLQRLVTPKNGITLDPFAGSGTSGCSASFEDIGECVLMEMYETYIPIIEARTAYWSIEKNRINYLENIKDKPIEEIESQLKMF